MNNIEEIINLREQIEKLQERITILEQIPNMIQSNACKKCGFELNQVMGYVCPNSDYLCGCGPSICSDSSMTSEPCHGLDIKNGSIPQWDELENIGKYQIISTGVDSSITSGGFHLEVGPDYKDSNSNTFGDLNNIIATFDSKSQVCRDERDKYSKGMDQLTQYWRENPEKAPKY